MTGLFRLFGSFGYSDVEQVPQQSGKVEACLFNLQPPAFSLPRQLEFLEFAVQLATILAVAGGHTIRFLVRVKRRS